MAMRVIAATAGCLVEQAARDVGPDDVAGVFVLDLVEAAAATAVAQRLPLRVRHFGKRLRPPEGRGLAGGHGVAIVGGGHVVGKLRRAAAPVKPPTQIKHAVAERPID